MPDTNSGTFPAEEARMATSIVDAGAIDPNAAVDPPTTPTRRLPVDVKYDITAPALFCHSCRFAVCDVEPLTTIPTLLAGV